MTPIETPSSTFTRKSTRVRKSGNLKLRFHHQALPQEYLDHFEATQNQFHNKEVTNGMSTPMSTNVRSSKRDRTATSTLPNHSPSNEPTLKCESDSKTDKSMQMWPQKGSKQQNGRDANSRAENDGKIQKSISKMTTHDLPYMGEITLDNFKPRRGRKPKKADICHLIYKNYGTVFPNQKPDEIEIEIDPLSNHQIETAINPSLLERRLTQSGGGGGGGVGDDESTDEHETKSNAEEPLNLCVRDRYDSDVMTIISDEDATDADKLTDFKAEMSLSSANDSLTTAHFPRNLKMALPNFQSALLDNKHGLIETGMDVETDINNYNCWQNSEMFLNPMVLYLQKIANANTNQPSSCGQRVIESPKTESDKNSKRPKPKRTLIPKKMSQLLKNDTANIATSHSSQSGAATTMTTTTTATSSTKSTSTSQGNQKNPNAPKRKRSAIFIPPVPEESSTNHATEVSICKFKFTGGAKPSLQEKKMLSVDAGGNFRYYSGTGDKSIRGYEFFPRESLKQSSLMSASSAGAFLNTAGQKITNDIPPPSFGLSNELLQIPELNAPNSVDILSSDHSASNSIPQHQLQNPKQHYLTGRKRKSKRSMQREKLEKTFKEKGFLIQTQQLEQAEGTYCKFRQLRKFTRYLFRSWKDYLPGELQQNQNSAAAPTTLNQAITEHKGIDTSSSHFIPSPPPSNDD